MEDVFDPDRSSPTSPSFPHASSGGSTGLTTGRIRTGPPIKTFGGDGFGVTSLRLSRNFSKERTKETKDSENIFAFLNFVLFVTLVVSTYSLRARQAHYPESSRDEEKFRRINDGVTG